MTATLFRHLNEQGYKFSMIIIVHLLVLWICLPCIILAIDYFSVISYNVRELWLTNCYTQVEFLTQLFFCVICKHFMKKYVITDLGTARGGDI